MFLRNVVSTYNTTRRHYPEEYSLPVHDVNTRRNNKHIGGGQLKSTYMKYIKQQSNCGCMKARRKPIARGQGAVWWDCGRQETCGRGKDLVLPNMVLETGYKPTYRDRRCESDMTMQVAYLHFPLSPFLPMSFWFRDHKQVKPVKTLVRTTCSCKMHLLTKIRALYSNLCHLKSEHYKFTVPTEE